MSYYQKYRPAKVDELDLISVRENLQAVMKTGKLSHAYLLVGPRGSGKTSTARILAKVINCEKNIEGKPWQEACGECESCKLIDSGAAVDILEMDAASHRGIDDVRELREKVRLMPVALKKKVYIIDEVHMLTTEAFNALLKTLEEPPEHAVFFLCTTEAHKVPETINSRCTKIAFTKATGGEVERSLMKAVMGESLKVGEEVIRLLAGAVDGSFREGHKLLEQLVASGKDIDETLVREQLGLVGNLAVTRLLEAVRLGKVEEIGQYLDEEESLGIGAETLVKEMLVRLKERIRLAISEGRGFVWEANLMKGLIKNSEKIKWSPLPYLPIELALVKSGLKARGKTGGGGDGKKEEPRVEQKREERVEKVETRQEKVEEVVTAKVEEKVEDVVKVVPRARMVDIKIDQVVNQWNELLTRLIPMNQSVAGLMRSAKPKEIEGDSLTVEVFYKFHKEQLEMDARKRLVEEAMQTLWGPMRIRCVLGEKAENSMGSQMGEDRVRDSGEQVLTQAAEEIFGGSDTMGSVKN